MRNTARENLNADLLFALRKIWDYEDNNTARTGGFFVDFDFGHGENLVNDAELNRFYTNVPDSISFTDNNNDKLVSQWTKLT